MRKEYSGSKVDLFRFCERKFEYRYVEHRHSNLISPQAALGEFGHVLAYNFFKEHEGRTMADYYQKAETYATSMVWYWSQWDPVGVKRDGKKVNWESSSQKLTMSKSVKTICVNLYNQLRDENAPLAKERTFTIRVDGRKYVGRFDAILHGGIIRDYKTGLYLPTDIKIATNPQFTIYALALTSILKQMPEISEQLGISKETLKQIINSY